jgi:transcriptional regulator GlxA family with amidase domain
MTLYSAETSVASKIAVGILLFDEVEVLDFAGPYEVFSRTRLKPGVASRRSDDTAPFHVFTLAQQERPVRAIGGLQVTPDFTFASAPSIDLIVIPGGFGTRALLEDGPVLSWVRQTAAHAKLTTSVCTGALLLAAAGLLEGRRATTHWGAYDLLARFPNVTVDRDRRVVDDGVITSGGVSAGIDMAFQVVEKICGKDVANETAHYIEYRR